MLTEREWATHIHRVNSRTKDPEGSITFYRNAPGFRLGRPDRKIRSKWRRIWWARQDLNLQPDRYERPALTIELRARPERGEGGYQTRPAQATGRRARPDARAGDTRPG